MTRVELLKSLRSLVNYHRSIGVEYYPDGDAVQSGLQSLDKVIAHTQGQTISAPQIGKISAQTGGKNDDSEKKQRKTATNGELEVEIRSCQSCSLFKSRSVATPGTGGSNPRLLIIGDWLTLPVNQPVDDHLLFGLEQDRMLAKMISAMGLGTDDVFITNMIKCSVPELVNPTTKQITTCSNYIKRQIAILSPRVVCTMGTIASQMLLGSSQSLIQLRGRFHSYRLDGGSEILVMPTFHPSYLLKNPEMKKPTWNDLQVIKKSFDQSR